MIPHEPNHMERKMITAAIIFLLLLLLSISSLGQADAGSALSSLELQVMGTKMTDASLSERIRTMEMFLQQPGSGKASMEYRLERLLATSRQRTTGRDRESAVQAYNHGVDASNRGDQEEAIRAYQEALQRDPSFIEAFNNLGNLYERSRQYNEALRIYQSALQQLPDEPLLHRNAGVVLEKMGNVQEALNQYQQYVALSSNPDPAIVAIVESYNTQRQLGKASPDYAALSQEGSQGEKLLWPKPLNPIPVFIQFNADQAPFLPAIRESLRQWEKATLRRVRFKETNSSDDARIWITLQEGPLAHPYLEVGHASYDVSPTEEPGERRLNLKVSITVNTGESDASLSSQERFAQVKRLALHEIGHAIGIWGHSPDPGDIMYLRPIVSQLSQRDIRTIQRLYNEKPTSSSKLKELL